MKIKFAVYFSLVCWVAAISYILFSLEERKWEIRAVRAGVGEYNEEKNFQFKKPREIFMQEMEKEVESGKIRIGPPVESKPSEKSGKLGGFIAPEIGGQIEL